MKPSICRMVVYRQPPGAVPWNGKSEHPAVITSVLSPTLVNLQVFFDNGPVEVRTSVSYDERPDVERPLHHECWHWPERVE